MVANHYLGPDTSRSKLAALRRSGAVVAALRRRGVHHGWVAVQGEAQVPSDPAALWQAARAVPIPGVLAPYLDTAAPLLSGSLAMFDRLREGGRFLREIESRVAGGDGSQFEVTSSTVDLLEPREVEKVYADPRKAAGVTATDLWAKLSWIADDDSDLSMRIRFSCGVERLDEWVGDVHRAVWADRFAEVVFPECELLTCHEGLRDAIATLVGEPVRCSERIVYSNAPGGGAVFHHDADPGQRGVVYGQLVGWTGWLALAKRELAEVVAEHVTGTPLAAAFGTPEAALRGLDGGAAGVGGADQALWVVLNRDPAFTERVVARGGFTLLRAGDVILLPTHRPDDVAWHAVFALGREPSLAHSYGLFAASP